MPSALKSTYSLDAVSLDRLQRLARRWQVSKTEAIRRALRKADESDARGADRRLAALHSLQQSLKKRGVDFEEWKATMRNARR